MSMNGPVSHEHVNYEPPLFYRITGRLNAVVWRLPLPRRLLAKLSMLVYHNPPIPGELVLEILDALDAAGVRCWIRGGWGVDALAGKRTRTHEDLDLIIEDDANLRAVEALEDLGFSRWYDVDSDVPLFSRIVLHDHPVAGRAVDLQPLDISAGHVEFSTGTIENRQVACLSLQSQLTTHSNYRKRPCDRADLAVLNSLPQGPAIPSGSSSGKLS
jgi:lincosamide nucleotidyltransferase A/C/D/E